jgi:hypothetical protein
MSSLTRYMICFLFLLSFMASMACATESRLVSAIESSD